MVFKYRSIVWLVALAFAVSLSVGPPKANAAQELLILTGNGYQPYADKNLPKGGLASMLVTAVFAEMGFRAQPVYADWAAAKKAVAFGRYLATYPWVHTKDREEKFIFSGKLFSSRPHIFQHGGVRRYQTIESMAGKTLCTTKGWAVDASLAEEVEAGRIRNVFGPSTKACFQALYDQKVDLVAAELRLGAALAEQIDSAKWYKNKRFTKEGTPHYVMFTKQHPKAYKWAKSFNKALNRLRKAGVLTALIKSYYAQEQ